MYLSKQLPPDQAYERSIRVDKVMVVKVSTDHAAVRSWRDVRLCRFLNAWCIAIP
jgi:hypothetical protein